MAIVKDTRFGLSAFVLALATSFSACSVATNTPTSPSGAIGSTALTPDALSATWKLQSIQPEGQAEIAAPASAAYTINIGERLSVRADCNLCSASYSLSGHTLSMTQGMACTRAACPTMPFETQFEQMLTGDQEVSMSGTTMTWRSPRGTVMFSR